MCTEFQVCIVFRLVRGVTQIRTHTRIDINENRNIPYRQRRFKSLSNSFLTHQVFLRTDIRYSIKLVDVRFHFKFFQQLKVDVHGENIAFFIASYDFPSFHETFFLLSIVSKISVS